MILSSTNVDERETLTGLLTLHWNIWVYMEKYNDWALAIAAYNSGPGRSKSNYGYIRGPQFLGYQEYLPRAPAIMFLLSSLQHT